MSMCRFGPLLLGATVLVSGCMGSSDVRPTGPGWGPAEVAYAGLRYTGEGNSSCCGGAFEGIPLTVTMPTTGSATLRGVMRGDINGDYRDGTSKVVADFAASKVTVSGEIDFTGVSTGDGIVQFKQSARLRGNHFQGGKGDSYVFGHFYGPDAMAAAGSISTRAASGTDVHAQFIADR